VYYRLAPLGLVLVLVLYLWYSGGLYFMGFRAFGRGNPEFFQVDMMNFINNQVDAMYRFWKGVL
jgi:hypothetical protein